MNYAEMMESFKPGMIARRTTWDQHFTLQLKEGDVVRLHDDRYPVQSFNPVWKQQGYDAMAEDYLFYVPNVMFKAHSNRPKYLRAFASGTALRFNNEKALHRHQPQIYSGGTTAPQ